MKRAITGIAAASLALGAFAPAAFAATTYTPYKTTIVVNGQTLSNPYAFAFSDGSNNTTYIPIYYVGKALEAAGFKQTWTGNTWVLSTNTKTDFSSIQVGTGNASIVVNGQLVKKVNTHVAKDPAGGPNAVATTYMPIYYVDQIFQAAGITFSWDGKTWSVSSPQSQPAQTTQLNLSPITVKGQSVGNGSDSSPAIAVVNNSITFTTQVTDANGNPVSGQAVQFLVSTTNNITAKDGSGNILNSASLSAPIVIGNKTFNDYYTVPVDASGNASIQFTSTASSNYPLYVVGQLPAPLNGQYVRTAPATAQWGLPGTLVLSPMYSSSSQPDQLNFSSSSNPKAGLVAMVATVLPSAGSTASVAGQQVKFTVSAANTSPVGTPGTPNVFITDATGQTVTNGGVVQPLGPGAGFGQQVTYVATTDQNGQAVMYLNSNQVTQNSVPITGQSVMAQVWAQLVNGGSSQGSSYLQWQYTGVPAKVANLTPSNVLNSPVLTDQNRENATSGSSLTIAGQVQDAAGNPVANAQLVIVDANLATGQYTGADGTDSWVDSSGNKHPFNGSSFILTQSDANGNFQFTVSDTVNSQQQQNKQYYYVYYAPSTTGVVPGQQLPTGLQPLNVVGGNAIAVSWEPGTSVGAIGTSGSTLNTSYSSLSDIPTESVKGRMAGDNRDVYFAPYNSNAQQITPGQYPQDQLQYTLTLTQGFTFNKVIGVNVDSSAGTQSGGSNNLLNYLAQNFPSYYNQLAGNVYDVTSVSYTDQFSTSGEQATITSVSGYVFNSAGQATPFTFSGLSMPVTSYFPGNAKVNTSNYPSFNTNINGGTATVNINVQVYDYALSSGNQAQGGASGTATIQFVPASASTSLGVASDETTLMNYGPLLSAMAGLPNTVTLQGTAWQTDSGAKKTTSFITAPFTNDGNITVMSTIPQGGLQYNLQSDYKNKHRFHAIDGVVVPDEEQYAVSVSVLQNGSVQVNGQQLWQVPAGQNVVAYGLQNGTLYVLAQSQTNAASYTLYTVGGTTDTGYSDNAVHSNGQLTQVATFNAPPAYTSGVPQALGYTIDASGHLNVKWTNSSGVAKVSTDSTNAYANAAGLTLTPVEVVTADVVSEYTDNVNFTVSANGQNATATVQFTSPTGASNGNVSAVQFAPSNIVAQGGNTQQVTLTAMDINGNPLANQIITLAPSSSLNGLWITAVNGVGLQSSVNMSPPGSSANYTTEPTPIPLWNIGSGVLDYTTVSMPGTVVASGLGSSSEFIQLTTNTNGQVQLTLQDGAVTYAGLSNGVPTLQASQAIAINNALLQAYGPNGPSGSVSEAGHMTITWGGAPGSGSTGGSGGTGQNTAWLSNASAKYDGLLETNVQATVVSGVTSVSIFDQTNNTMLNNSATPSNGQLNVNVIGAAKGDTLVLTPYEGSTAGTPVNVTVQ
ncbi:MAG: hypothetical protein K6T31_02345 [Alicyclobacillus sp.]|nr:hypothetical protein [Alicyclobacillus sp.]